MLVLIELMKRLNTFKDLVKDITIHFNENYIILNLDTFKQFLMESNKITSIFISYGGNKSDYQNFLAISCLVIMMIIEFIKCCIEKICV
jgi:hypothetical protein